VRKPKSCFDPPNGRGGAQGRSAHDEKGIISSVQKPRPLIQLKVREGIQEQRGHDSEKKRPSFSRTGTHASKERARIKKKGGSSANRYTSIADLK